MRIVVADPDRLSGRALAFLLEEAGHDVVLARTGAEALAAVAHRDAGAVLVDSELPDVDAAALCADIRALHHTGPVLILSPARETPAKLDAFARGADDYVVRPYDPLEVATRLEVVARQGQGSCPRVTSAGSVLTVEDCTLWLSELTVRMPDREPVLLTPTEMRILEGLMRNSPAVVTRETLIGWVGGQPWLGDGNRIDVYVMRLRKKLETDPSHPRYLHTVRGQGYAFRRAAEPPPSPPDAGSTRAPG